MTVDDMINAAAVCLNEAQACCGGSDAGTPTKADEKVQRWSFVADAWMKLAAVTSELTSPPESAPA